MDLLRSDALTRAGFRHGFSTRDGGVSDGPFARLNLGGAVGDDPARVAENHRRLATAVGYDPDRLFQVSQVHGNAVYVVTPDDDATTLAARVQADALVVRRPGDAVAIRVADCVPVLLADVRTGHAGAAHAGWRGVASGVLAATVRSLAPRSPDDLVAAAGPCIGPCCFEVGDEVADQLVMATAPSVRVERPGRAHVDLWAAVRWQLAAIGVHAFETVGGCTRCDPARYFSFRRDGARSGRMVGVVAARDVP